ncbi:hypothetical protein, partial [Leptospira alstonii]|uniref:hypothetical protein n=1 Tax=Leptospira alstonii TaxID=28452 RepID=UPI001F1F93F8
VFNDLALPTKESPFPGFLIRRSIQINYVALTVNLFLQKFVRFSLVIFLAPLEGHNLAHKLKIILESENYTYFKCSDKDHNFYLQKV